MSFHQSGVTRSPNHWCDISWAASAHVVLLETRRRLVGFCQQQRLVVGDEADVLHRAEEVAAVRDADAVELRERERLPEIGLEMLKDPRRDARRVGRLRRPALRSDVSQRRRIASGRSALQDIPWPDGDRHQVGRHRRTLPEGHLAPARGRDALAFDRHVRERALMLGHGQRDPPRRAEARLVETRHGAARPQRLHLRQHVPVAGFLLLEESGDFAGGEGAPETQRQTRGAGGKGRREFQADDVLVAGNDLRRHARCLAGVDDRAGIVDREARRIDPDDVGWSSDADFDADGARIVVRIRIELELHVVAGRHDRIGKLQFRRRRRGGGRGRGRQERGGERADDRVQDLHRRSILVASRPDRYQSGRGGSIGAWFVAGAPICPAA